MTTITTRLYEITTEYEGDRFSHYIGVVDGGWDDRLLDTATDNRVFYFMDQDEFDRLAVGEDITGDGDVVIEIDREPSYIFEEHCDDALDVTKYEAKAGDEDSFSNLD